jgi:DNA-binding IclR family transcriptional regulator
MPHLTRAHDAVLSLLASLHEDTAPDAELVAALLGIPEAEAMRLLEDLEAAGCVASATGPIQ